MTSQLAKQLRFHLYMAQKEENALLSVANCVDNYVPSQNPGRYGKSIQPCRNSHACFWCTPPRLRKQGQKLADLISYWDREGSVYVATFNLAFPSGTSLSERYDYLRDCWSDLMSDSRAQKFRQTLSLKYVRVLEEYHQNGEWHPHFHVVFYVQPPEPFDSEDFSLDMRKLWASKAKGLGLHDTLSSLQHFAKFRSGTGDVLAKYLTKHGRVGLSLDLEGVDALNDKLPPLHLFQVGIGNGDSDALELWREFQLGSYKKRRISFSTAAKYDSDNIQEAKRLARQD